jgi:hypothetical protein
LSIANKRNNELEKNAILLSKENHSLKHKISSLEFKLANQDFRDEFSDEISGSLKNMSDDCLFSDIPVLAKIGISEVDDILSYYQSECVKNNISFELQLNDNIFYMVNHYISKEKLSILLADHIKNSIIAIKSSDNIYKSILVRIGLINGIYSIYIYDTGIEFDKEVLDNLGSKPITTHCDIGGSGFGFINTFDTLKEFNASLEINEIGSPCSDNYTKVIIIKFNNKHEFKINSYRSTY